LVKEVVSVNLPKDRELDIDYDEEADVLYISFGKPQPADDSEEVNDVTYRVRGNELIGTRPPRNIR
jgi:hypothetical protein